MTTEERYRLIYGNTARAVDTAPKPHPKKPKINKEQRKKSASESTFEIEWKNKRLYGAVLLIAILCISYVYLNAWNIQTRKHIAELKTNLNTMQIENDDLEAKIYSDIDENEIKNIAKKKLGMVKPSESHIIKYTNKNKDYVRQYEAIPE